MNQLDIDNLVREDSVHRSVYTDPELFDLEMKQLYGRAWIYVGHESQVRKPGEYRRTLIGGQDVIMIRGADNTVHVLYNRCPHRGIQVLSERDGCAERNLRCPYHGWAFRFDGQHLAAPLPEAFRGTAFDPGKPEFSMRKVARVDSYRGFVFASQSETGESLLEFLREARTSIDDLCDRSPVGEVEVAGGVYRIEYNFNWKLFYENVIDLMHPLTTHQSAWSGSRRTGKEMGETTPEMHIVESLSAPYAQLTKLQLVSFGNGHGFLGNIFRGVGDDSDPATLEHFECLREAYGEERAKEILGQSRHNTILYGSGALQALFQQFRVMRPVAVDRTLQEVQIFRLKGAPESVFKRTIMFANATFSPGSLVLHDDVECYERAQAGNGNNGGDWLSLHRRVGDDEQVGGQLKARDGTSELLIREQYRAWSNYMSTPIEAPVTVVGRAQDCTRNEDVSCAH